MSVMRNDNNKEHGALQTLFSYPAFMRFWFSRLFTTASSQMLMVALAWQIYDLTGSAWDLGLVGLLQFLPALALVLVTGHIIDHYDRRLILAACVGLLCLVAVALCWATATQQISRRWILGVSLLLGVARAFQMPAQQAISPLLVPPELLPRALAFSGAAMQAAIIVGPAIGGFVYALGAEVVYGLCALLLLIGAVLAWSIPPLQQQINVQPVSLKTVLAGIHFIRQHRIILGALSLDLFAVLLGGATALLPIYAKDILNVGPWGLGLLRSAPAVGALLMSVWLTRRPLETGVGRKMFIAVAVFGVATVVFAISTSFLLSLFALFVSGCADMVSVIIRQTLVQLETPDHMRGRVSAVNSIFIGASNQLGEFESGVTAAWLGPVGSVVLGGAGTLLIVVLWAKWFPELLQRERLQSDVRQTIQNTP